MATTDQDASEIQNTILNILHGFFETHKYLQSKTFEGAFKAAKKSARTTLQREKLVESLENLTDGFQKIIETLKKQDCSGQEKPDDSPMEICEDSSDDILPLKHAQDKCSTSEALTNDTEKVSSSKDGLALNDDCHEELDKLEDPTPQPRLDPNLVQVRAGKDEIERRIQAFMERKKFELNNNNCREYCNIMDTEQVVESCARTCAMFVPRADGKSHLKVTRVHNIYGPQTQQNADSPRKQVQCVPDVKPVVPPGDGGGDAASGSATTVSGAELLSVPPSGQKPPPAAEERIQNLEQHLGLHTNTSKDVFSRLRILEDRVLQLESLSPEYFTSMPAPKLRRKETRSQKNQVRSNNNTATQGLSLTDIEERIHSLKRSLQDKQQQIHIKQEPSSDQENTAHF